MSETDPFTRRVEPPLRREGYHRLVEDAAKNLLRYWQDKHPGKQAEIVARYNPHNHTFTLTAREKLA